MARGRPDLFPPDRGLQARMVVAMSVAALLTLTYLALLVAVLVLGLRSNDSDIQLLALAAVSMPFLLLFAGWVSTLRSATGPAAGYREAKPEDEERLRIAAERLCVVADLEPPDTKVEADRLPLSWTSAPPWRGPRIHVSTGMLDALPEPELRAVVAHELSHVAHRDALVMTLVGGPSVHVLRILRRMWDDDPVRAPFAFVVGLYFIVPALVLAFLARLVSRHRELAADRSAALITGSPAALASALVRLRDDMTGGEDILLSDLKLAAPRNQFHVLPVEKREPTGLRRVWASHPRLEDRLEALGEMEGTLQTARGTAPRVLEVG